MQPRRHSPPRRAGAVSLSGRTLLLVGLALLKGCAVEAEDTPSPVECELGDDAARPPAPSQVTLPPTTSGFDYQLSCPYPVPAGVRVVARDLSSPAAPDVYNICYVNAFQTQPDSDWSGARDSLVLRDAQGDRVVDPDWTDEYVLDIRTPEQRIQLVDIVGGWIAECAARGFDAVELDNLDTFARFPALIALDDTVSYASALVAVAHREQLAVAQKNAAEESARFRGIGFDFAIAEECWRFDECAQYVTHYGDHVFDVEYDADVFKRGCAARLPPLTILRDVDLLVPGPLYVRRECP